MSCEDRYNALNQRMNDIQNLGMNYVLERDKILKQRGLDPLLAAGEYERTKIQIRGKATRWEPEVSPNGHKVEDILKTNSVAQVIDKFIENYSEDDYPPMFQEFAHYDEDNGEMQKLSVAFEKECQLLAVDFLKRHADKVTSKALIGFAGANVCESTFNRMFN